MVSKLTAAIRLITRRARLSSLAINRFSTDPRPTSITDWLREWLAPKKSSTIRSGPLVRNIRGLSGFPSVKTSICTLPPGNAVNVTSVMRAPDWAFNPCETQNIVSRPIQRESCLRCRIIHSRFIDSNVLEFKTNYSPVRNSVCLVSQRPEAPWTNSSISRRPAVLSIPTILPMFCPR